ncbi:MAG: hypothetical protein EBX60_12345, partial [Betaproteobacteria bacterium]|nr:hypothetical protein [Betaproteobacteria bacterium]
MTEQALGDRHDVLMIRTEVQKVRSFQLEPGLRVGCGWWQFEVIVLDSAMRAQTAHSARPVDRGARLQLR